MKRLTVLVDMDDTLENLLPAWVNYLNKNHGTAVEPEEVNAWDLRIFFPGLSDKELYSMMNDPSFWENVTPKDGAQKYLKQIIDDGHRVFIVTSSYYKTLVPKMEKVLFKYFPYIAWEQVIIAHCKQIISGDVLIDDGVHNHIGGKYTSILFDAPHNRDFNESDYGIKRVNTWEEAYEAVCKLSEEGDDG